MTNAMTTAAQNLNLDTGLPVWILVPAIMLIAIGSVVLIKWFYNKANKKSKPPVEPVV